VVERKELWVEDLVWIEDDEAVEAMLGGVLVLFCAEGVSRVGSDVWSQLRVQLRNVANPDPPV
jgi:hypothetical protein